MRNAFIGYTYQKKVIALLLTKMDVERRIDKIEIEANVNNEFDDAKVTSDNIEYYFQIKDIEGISLKNLTTSNNHIIINGKSHKLSKSVNILFFKSISLFPNCEIFGFPAHKLSGIYIVSFSRAEIDDEIVRLYKDNIHRIQDIGRYFNDCLDKRKLIILRENLPSINVFSTELLERTINIGRKHLKIENILVIEGKPGVGKSHLVNILKEEYTNSLIYRFWISSQDKDYNQRLKYTNFISDFSKKLFNDLLHRNETEIIRKIKAMKKTVIIDGLDHVENYNNKELGKYIDFIEQLQTKCKVIVLTRPLQKEITWKKHLLGNWNNKQTRKVLNELFHISGYTITQEIFTITDGYPILVKYIAEHYKENKSIPKLNKFESIESYYEQIISQEKGKHALSLFLCSRSFFMKSEIDMMLEEESSIFVNEFIKEHPYLFEIRLNRISLFHDSFNTYLKKQEINYSERLKKINELVYHSINNLNKRFLSRFGSFNLEPQMKKDIIRKYSSLDLFKELVKDVVDFEAVCSFYIQLREALCQMLPDELEIMHYYDLSLILNIVYRDHVSTLNSFLYTYVKVLLFNDYTEEDITSSKYLFAMLYFVKTNDPTLLYNITSDNLYSTESFYEQLLYDVEEENYFFQQHNKSLTEERISELLKDKVELKDNLTYILENLFLHKNSIHPFSDLYTCVNKYMAGEEKEAISILKLFLDRLNTQSHYPSWILRDAKRNILAFGEKSKINDYKTPSLNNFIIKNKDLGSFDLRVEILNFIRLSLHEKRKIDISSIALFWTKYYQRKDYSLFTIALALHVFERKGYVPIIESCNLIIEIQEVSEKGYRGLLSDYIEQYSPDIISFITENFNIENLRIGWFYLSPEYINVFPDKIFNRALAQVLNYHRYNRKIEFKEIQNVLLSNRKEELISELDFWKYSVQISKSHPIIEEFKGTKIRFKEFSLDDDKYNFKEDSHSRFNKGILSIEDQEFIIKNELKSYEVAGFSNGFYSALADIDIYKIFGEEDIKKNIKNILYNAMMGEVRGINSFYDLYHFPGNVPKLIYDNNIDSDFEKLFHSFLNFLSLSMFNLNSRENKYNKRE